MFTVKVFDAGLKRKTYLCSSYTVDSKNKHIFLYMENTESILVAIDIEKYPAVYVENPAGKTIDAFKVFRIPGEKDKVEYRGF